jgi:hypothetical protein
MSSAALVTALFAGRGEGLWNGATGIRSAAVAASLAVAQPRTIGWLERADGSLLVSYAAPGDLNLDGSIDILDISNVASSFNVDFGGSAVWEQGDFNYDGSVDMLDVADVLAVELFNQGDYRGFGSSVSGGVAAVPEPSASTLIPVVAVVAGWCRLRRLRVVRIGAKGRASRA